MSDERVFRITPGTVCRYEIEEMVPLLIFWTRWKYRGQSDSYKTLAEAAKLCGKLIGGPREKSTENTS